MMKYPFLSFALSILAASIMASCSSDEPNSRSSSEMCYDFATFDGIEAYISYFSLQKSDDSPLITYHCTQLLKADSKIDFGDRLIIGYTPLEHSVPYISGKITLHGYRELDNTSKGVNIFEHDQLDLRSDQIKMVSLTRTGPFINMQLQLFCAVTGDPKTLELRADENEISQPFPTLHLVYEAEKPGENAMNGYASFDISEIWQLSTCQGVTISYAGSATTFKK